jgi:hypothetical protein
MPHGVLGRIEFNDSYGVLDGPSSVDGSSVAGIAGILHCFPRHILRDQQESRFHTFSPAASEVGSFP